MAQLQDSTDTTVSIALETVLLCVVLVSYHTRTCSRVLQFLKVAGTRSSIEFLYFSAVHFSMMAYLYSAVSCSVLHTNIVQCIAVFYVLI